MGRRDYQEPVVGVRALNSPVQQPVKAVHDSTPPLPVLDDPQVFNNSYGPIGSRSMASQYYDSNDLYAPLEMEREVDALLKEDTTYDRASPFYSSPERGFGKVNAFPQYGKQSAP